MDFRFTEEQEIMRSTVQKFVEKELTKEYIREWDNDENMNWLSPEKLEKAAEIGLLGISVPKEYEGLDGDLIDGVIITEEVARRSPAAIRPSGSGEVPPLRRLRSLADGAGHRCPLVRPGPAVSS